MDTSETLDLQPSNKRGSASQQQQNSKKPRNAYTGRAKQPIRPVSCFNPDLRQATATPIANTGKVHFWYNASVAREEISPRLQSALANSFPDKTPIPQQVQKPYPTQDQCSVVGCGAPYHDYRSCPVFLNYFQKHEYILPNGPLSEAEASSLVRNCHHLHCMQAMLY